MPPCLPLKVKVSCGRVNSSSKGAISKVLARSKEYFGANALYNNAQMSMIKGVILAELCYNSTVTYLDSIPDVEFLTMNPDIEITYNEQKINEISFSLDTNLEQNYDFVSLAIRDLLVGLGLSSSYRYNPISGALINPSQELTPFESLIDKMLGSHDNPVVRLANATKGELLLDVSTTKTLKLYAPSPWQNGTSLNYFIPQDGSSVSNILSYNFCKGMVTRSLSDDYSEFIFSNLLGWKPNFVTSTSTPSSSAGGSTSLLMPYNGSISFSSSTYGISTEVDNIQPKSILYANYHENEELNEYIESFHPFLYDSNSIPSEGTSISVLKKDGSWDLVKCFSAYIPDMSFNMSDLKFNYDEDQYARTIDGYLRARITTKHRNSFGRINYNSTFFVIDYLPQKINLSYAFINPSTTRASLLTEPNNTVRIYFSNTEGINRIVLERLRQGSRVPSKIEIKDFKKGFFETTIDKITTFTAVGYNDNGTSIGLPITITPISNELSLNFRLNDNCIYFEPTEKSNNYNYTITPIGTTTYQGIRNGTATGTIDVSSLSEGLYVLTIVETKSGRSNSFKFRR